MLLLQGLKVCGRAALMTFDKCCVRGR